MRQLEDDRPLCALVMTGALHPVHKGHVQMMIRARLEVEEVYGYHCFVGWMSTSHDEYVGPKASHKKRRLIGATHRVKLIELATEEAGQAHWLAASNYESSAARFVDFYYVTKEAHRVVEEERCRILQVDDGAEPISPAFYNKMRVFYVCGFDLAVNCGLGNGFRADNVGIIIVGRNGEKLDRFDANASRLVYKAAADPEFEHFSSSLVHAAFKSKDLEEARRLLGDQAIAYILENSLL
jgi:nicotinamide mononucleotide adenylyltransferase